MDLTTWVAWVIDLPLYGFFLCLSFILISSSCIADNILTCAQKLMKSQLNLAHATKNGRNQEEIKKKTKPGCLEETVRLIVHGLSPEKKKK